ncbi:MAG: ATP-binding protein [Pirellulaceae bacterium]
MMRSLKSRLLLGIGVSSALILIASGVVLSVASRRALVNEFDHSLLEVARTLAALVENAEGRIHSEMAERELAQFARQVRPDYYQMWQRDGMTLERSSRLVDGDLPRLGARVDHPQFAFVTLPDGRPGRVVTLTFVPSREAPNEEEENDGNEDSKRSTANNDRLQQTTVPPLTLAIARDTIDLDRSVSRIQWILAVVLSAAVALALLMASLIVRIGLKPLRTSAAQIAEIDGKTLSTRLDAARAPTEVRSVVERLNGLLDRLDEAFQRERAFSANVAHELRTPLAGLRSTIEVALSQPRPVDDYQRALGQCLSICLATESLMENLLVLARLDAGQCRPQREAVALDEALRKAWSPLATRATSRGLEVSWQLATQIQLDTDPTLLSLILRNLLDNAVSYANDNSQIDVTASVSDAATSINVRNVAVGLPWDLAERVFDRFWRADAARAGTGQNAGLGLPLCREAARVLGGDLTVTVQDGLFNAGLQFRRSHP